MRLSDRGPDAGADPRPPAGPAPGGPPARAGPGGPGPAGRVPRPVRRHAAPGIHPRPRGRRVRRPDHRPGAGPLPAPHDRGRHGPRRRGAPGVRLLRQVAPGRGGGGGPGAGRGHPHRPLADGGGRRRGAAVIALRLPVLRRLFRATHPRLLLLQFAPGHVPHLRRPGHQDRIRPGPAHPASRQVPAQGRHAHHQGTAQPLASVPV